MTVITVTVSGPGNVINIEVRAIEKLFRDYGYQVEIDNEYPPENDVPITDRHANMTNIKIVADHCPWGG